MNTINSVSLIMRHVTIALCVATFSVVALNCVRAQTSVPHIASIDLKLQALADKVWMVQGQAALATPSNQGFISNAAFVETSDSIVVIDALATPALAEKLIREIAALTPKPISHVIVTHYHADHIYGLQAFKTHGAKIVAHRRALEYLQSDTARLRLQATREELAPWVNADTQLVPADMWIDGDTTLRIGDTTFNLLTMGPAHTAEDIAIHVPSRATLFVGDLVFRGRLPFVGTANSKRWVESLDRLLTIDAKLIVPGHGPASTQLREDLQLTRDYLAYLRQTMRDAVRDMEAFDAAYARTDWTHFSKVPMFEFANRMNAYNVYLQLEQESLSAPK